MYKLFVVLSIAVYCSASGYGVSLGGGGGGYAIPAAITSKRNVEIKPVYLPQDPIEPQVIEVPALDMPVKIVYNSKSSGVFVQQVHTPGAPGQVEATKSEEEPHRVIHEVVRPVIQELREVIVPYRRVIQEIQPVVEEVQTTIARGEGRAGSVGLGLGGGIALGGLALGNGGEGGLGGGIGGGLGGALVNGNGVGRGLRSDDLIIGLGGLGGGKGGYRAAKA